MAIYDYTCINKECTDNGKVKEVMQKISDPAPKCEVCNEEMQRMVSSSGGFQLKGTGWYKNGTH